MNDFESSFLAVKPLLSIKNFAMPIIITKIIGERRIVLNTLSLALYCFSCILNNDLAQNVVNCMPNACFVCG